MAASKLPGQLSIHESAAEGATWTSPWMTNDSRARGIRLWQKVSAASGTTPTLDTKIQTQDPESGDGVDLVGAAFAQLTTTSAALDLVVYPGIAETNNRSVSDVLPVRWRVVATIGGTTPSFTLTIGGEYLP